MNTKTAIDATVESLFLKKNEQQILKAFFYRVGLNMTPREAGKELGLSRNQVNALNTARLYRLTEQSKDETFKYNFKRAKDRIETIIVYKSLQAHSKHVRKIARRVEGSHRLLIFNQ